jgi:thioredoxin 1
LDSEILKKEKNMSHPLEVTDANFKDEVLNSDKPVLVDFWAEWCGPCKMIAPAVAELARDYEGRAKICKLDVDNNYQTAGEYGIRSIPSLLIFKNGKVVDQIVGAVSKQRLKEKLEANL